jgi:hypothetical protein
MASTKPIAVVIGKNQSEEEFYIPFFEFYL